MLELTPEWAQPCMVTVKSAGQRADRLKSKRCALRYTGVLPIASGEAPALRFVRILEGVSATGVVRIEPGVAAGVGKSVPKGRPTEDGSDASVVDYEAEAQQERGLAEWRLSLACCRGCAPGGAPGWE